MNFKEYLRRELNEMPLYIDYEWAGDGKCHNHSQRVIREEFEKMFIVDCGDQKVTVLMSKTLRPQVTIVGITEEVNAFDDRVSVYYLTFKTKDDQDFEHDSPISDLGENIMQVSGIKMDEKYRQFGIAYDTYVTLVKSGNVLVSDSTQFKGAKLLWKRLARTQNAIGLKVRILDTVRMKWIICDDGSEFYNTKNLDDSKIWTPTTDYKGMDLVLVLSQN